MKNTRAFIYIIPMFLFVISCQPIEAAEDGQSANIYDVQNLINPITTTASNNNSQLHGAKSLDAEATANVYNHTNTLRNRLSDDYWHAINEISPTLSPEMAERVISEKNGRVIAAIRDQNFSELANYIHPARGVRITLFNMASTEDVILTGIDFLSNDIYTWGVEGSGEDIRMSIEELFDAYLYQRDYANDSRFYNNSEQVLYNNYIWGNEYIFYDKCISVFYMYGGIEELANLGWSGLKLIYQEHSDQSWYLSGIIYCRKT
jgi:hypothetical protein